VTDARLRTRRPAPGRRLRAAALGIVLAALAAAGVPPAGARAETVPLDSLTVGSLVERSDAVVIVTAQAADDDRSPSPPAGGEGGDAVERTFAVTETLRGTVGDDSVSVTLPVRTGGAEAVRQGERYLAFLVRRGTGDWTTLPLPWGLRSLADPDVSPLADYARTFASCLGPDGRVARPAELAEALVVGLASDASGIPFCAGRDLLRHGEELGPGLTSAQRIRVTDALRRPRKIDQDFVAIALAAGEFGGPGTDGALVDRLLQDDVRPQRLNVVDALRRCADTSTVARLVDEMEGAHDARRADLANALGRLGLREAVPSLVRLLGDPATAVRVEAAHSVGLLARDLRAVRPGDDPEAARPRLVEALDGVLALTRSATTDNERRASLWALAQLDFPAAWDALRRIAGLAEPRDPAGSPAEGEGTAGAAGDGGSGAADAAPAADDPSDPQSRLRALARRYLTHPRTALLLEPR